MEIKKNVWALLPIFIFLILYLGLGILFEYILKINMGFHSISIVVVFFISLLIACLQNRKLSFDDKLKIMAKGVGDRNIIIMILIFLLAGIFVGVTGISSAEAIAYLLLSVTPGRFAVAVIFIAACFISTAMGTSVGTITLVTPIAVMISKISGFSLPLCIASVVGGSMFGDNLSLISDTTIAACKSQGCQMKDKFRMNFKIALPAALITLILILFLTWSSNVPQIKNSDYDIVLLLPYVLVLITSISGINVFLVLVIGIFAGFICSATHGNVSMIELINNIDVGVTGMFETVIATILAAAMCALIRVYGGFEAILFFVRKIFRGPIGGRLGIGLIVGLMNIATANNTVSIIMAAPIAKQLSSEYKIEAKESASLLDIFSCVFQIILPYGAQMLIAISQVALLGEKISAFQIIPYLFYPFMLLISSLIFICFSNKTAIL